MGMEEKMIYSISTKDLEIIKEHRDLMDDIIAGEYTPDSFTNQLINELIKKLEK